MLRWRLYFVFEGVLQGIVFFRKKFLRALLILIPIWLSHFKLNVTTTPRCLCEFTFNKLLPLRITPVTDLKLRVFVLAVLASIPVQRFQLCNLAKTSWKLVVLNKSFKSSAKIQGIASKKIAGRSLINSKMRSGRNTEPCGTPLSTGKGIWELTLRRSFLCWRLSCNQGTQQTECLKIVYI